MNVVGSLGWQKKDIVVAIDRDLWDQQRKTRKRPYVRGLMDGYEAKHYRKFLYLNI